MLYSHSFFSSLKNKIHNPIFPIVRDFGFFVFIRIYNIASRFFIPLSRKIIQTAEVLTEKHSLYIACIFFRESEQIIGNLRIDDLKRNHHIMDLRCGKRIQNHHIMDLRSGKRIRNHHVMDLRSGKRIRNHANVSRQNQAKTNRKYINIT